ncbi:hypothetical protein OIU91_03315 [Streptomyces sp. NBC_01456]|uniref:hypothetical protein n=1 Tax=Streptomyces sp. NBC_01456 TaxID=2975868 RepID=UPI002E365A23|nr:hypothetical protein [Streptomyces sp. NBC_01456]
METKYHFAPDGRVLSAAVGKSGRILLNGERLTPLVAERLRREMPFLAQMVTFYENNQAVGRGLGGGPEGVVVMLHPPSGLNPLAPLDPETMDRAQRATEALIRAGRAGEGVGAMVIPFPSQRGVLGPAGDAAGLNAKE